MGWGFDPPALHLYPGCAFMALSALGCCTRCYYVEKKLKFKHAFLNLKFRRLRREARKEGNYYVPGDPKLAFVMRIRGINQVKILE